MEERPLPPVPLLLTAAAGALHLAAARAHLEVSILLAAAFVAVAAVQLVLVATARRRPDATTEVLVLVNLVAVGAWAVSRTVGLPLVGTGVEPVGTGDVVTVVLQVLAVVGALLPATSWTRTLASAPSALVASLAVVAFAAPLVGHTHAPEHPHAAADPSHAGAEMPSLPTGITGSPLIDREQAAVMKARMTGLGNPTASSLAGADGHGHTGGSDDHPDGIDGGDHPHE